MKWEDLREQARRILENEPTAGFEDRTFSTRSGSFSVKVKVDVTHRAETDHYTTVRWGETCATHFTVRCRDTGAKDGNGRTIFESLNGELFVFIVDHGSAEFFGRASLEPPTFEAKPR